mmetsp:Transcript_23091/g.61034  ORF Transcript_23091/g.61034 Transcript_23091/m.61034 type:complete len:365 (-) Transcript_23091:405-1499(-)
MQPPRHISQQKLVGNVFCAQGHRPLRKAAPQIVTLRIISRGENIATKQSTSSSRDRGHQGSGAAAISAEQGAVLAHHWPPVPPVLRPQGGARGNLTPRQRLDDAPVAEDQGHGACRSGGRDEVAQCRRVPRHLDVRRPPGLLWLRRGAPRAGPLGAGAEVHQPAPHLGDLARQRLGCRQVLGNVWREEAPRGERMRHYAAHLRQRHAGRLQRQGGRPQGSREGRQHHQADVGWGNTAVPEQLCTDSTRIVLALWGEASVDQRTVREFPIQILVDVGLLRDVGHRLTMPHQHRRRQWPRTWLDHRLRGRRLCQAGTRSGVQLLGTLQILILNCLADNLQDIWPLSGHPVNQRGQRLTWQVQEKLD